jgi:hypothetical protein
LLGVTRSQRVGEDLPLAVQLRQAWDEIAAQQQQAGDCGEGTEREFDVRQCHRDVVQGRYPLDPAQ